MKKILIITPYFPPSNAADMQRVRMSLPYFYQLGWQAEVVAVHPEFSDINKDSLLAKTIPKNTKIHYVKAFNKHITRKFGLGSIALRSIWYYKSYVDKLLKKENFDLIYFSTTQFPVCILGSYWKKKFQVPFVIDMQDPWHSDYYNDKPKSEQPAKYWFSYRLNKYLEPIAMEQCDGLISVSQDYISTLQSRYPQLADKPYAVITFGAFDKDFEILEELNVKPLFLKNPGKINLIYIGRGGADMREALNILFKSFLKGLQINPTIFNQVKFHFIGTSYAPNGEGKQSIVPLAERMGLSKYVNESTDRVSFFEGLATLKEADGLVIPGSNDPGYTASKLYPYILTKKPLLGIFHPKSSALKIINDCSAGKTLTLFDDDSLAFPALEAFITSVIDRIRPATKWKNFERYTAEEMTKKQVNLFNTVVNGSPQTNF